MGKFKTKELLISIIVLAILGCMTTCVLADDNTSTDPDDILNQMKQSEGKTGDANKVNAVNILDGTTNVVSLNDLDNNSTNVVSLSDLDNNTTNNETPEKLSDTGLGDVYSSIVLVVIFSASTVYAYKKVKEYNA